MNTYTITAFAQNGEKILDESFEAENDSQAKGIGEKILNKKELSERTHRCTSSSGKLLLFHS